MKEPPKEAMLARFDDEKFVEDIIGKLQGSIAFEVMCHVDILDKQKAKAIISSAFHKAGVRMKEKK